jgi:hypothetical protein
MPIRASNWFVPCPSAPRPKRWAIVVALRSQSACHAQIGGRERRIKGERERSREGVKGRGGEGQRESPPAQCAPARHGCAASAEGLVADFKTCDTYLHERVADLKTCVANLISNMCLYTVDMIMVTVVMFST